MQQKSRKHIAKKENPKPSVSRVWEIDMFCQEYARHILLSLFLLVGLSVWGRDGQKIFRRITAADLESGATYLLVAYDSKDKAGHYALTSEAFKMQLHAVQVPGGAEIVTSDDAHCWRLDAADGGWRLWSVAQQNYLAAHSRSHTGVKFDSNLPLTFQLSWTLTHEVRFGIPNGSRFLSISHLADDYYYGLYTAFSADTLNIHLYKEVVAQSLIPSAPLPSSGATAGLLINGRQRSLLSGLTSTSAEGRLLQDSTWALSDAQTWTLVSDETENFGLKNAEGHWLMPQAQQLSLTDEPADSLSWRLHYGQIVSRQSVASTPFVLASKADSQTLMLMSQDSVDNKKYLPVSLVIGAPKPTQKLTDAGVLLLLGGWSCQQIEQLDVSASKTLSTEQALLPLEKTVWPAALRQSNRLICITEKQAEAMAEVEANILVKNSDGYTPLNPITLRDKQPLHIPYAFQIGQGGLTYTRDCHTDGKWETCILPFGVTLPPVCEGAVYVDRIGFVRQQTIAAHSPFVFRYLGRSIASHIPLTFVAETQMITPASPTHTPFIGTYDTLRVEGLSPITYLLSADGIRFLRAEAGSRLLPFRAGFVTDAQAYAFSINFDVTTTALWPQAEQPHSFDCRRLDGTWVGSGRHWADFSATLPRGLYIVNGQIIIHTK